MENYRKADARPVYSAVQPNIQEIPAVATIEASSPWKNADVSFNYVNVDYPKLHTHSHWEMLIILSGSVTHEINGNTYTLSRGDACLIRPQDCHRLFHSLSGEKECYQQLNFLIRTECLQAYTALVDPGLYSQLLEHPMPLVFSLENSLLGEVQKRTVAIYTDNTATPPRKICVPAS